MAITPGCFSWLRGLVGGSDSTRQSGSAAPPPDAGTSIPLDNLPQRPQPARVNDGRPPRQPLSQLLPADRLDTGERGPTSISHRPPATLAPKGETALRKLDGEERQRVVEGLPRWDKGVDLASAVRTHVDARLKAAASAGRQPIVLLGEDHASKTSLIAELGAMKAVHDIHGSGATVMFEHTPDRIGEWNEQAARMQAAIPGNPQGSDAKALEAQWEDAFESGDYHGRQLRQFNTSKSHFAARLGFARTGFDTLHPASRSLALSEDRERAMETAIRAQAATKPSPVVVLAGHMHVPTLHERLAADFDVIALSTVKGLDSPFLSPAEAPRADYLLTHPDVMCVSALGDTETAPVGYLQLMQQLGA